MTKNLNLTIARAEYAQETEAQKAFTQELNWGNVSPLLLPYWRLRNGDRIPKAGALPILEALGATVTDLSRKREVIHFFHKGEHGYIDACDSYGPPWGATILETIQVVDASHEEVFSWGNDCREDRIIWALVDWKRFLRVISILRKRLRAPLDQAVHLASFMLAGGSWSWHEESMHLWVPISPLSREALAWVIWAYAKEDWANFPIGLIWRVMMAHQRVTSWEGYGPVEEVTSVRWTDEPSLEGLIETFRYDARAEWTALEQAGFPCNIPSIRVEQGEYVLRTLPKNDPRGLFLGEFTDCCQHPGGVGSSSAFHGAFNPDGGFLVLEKKGHIRAQAWVWLSGDRLVLDNVEALGTLKSELQEIFIQAAEAWRAQGIKEVRIGTGMSDLDLSGFPSCNAIPTPKGCYSDAKGGQLVIQR
jgi:hypothetical protein